MQAQRFIESLAYSPSSAWAARPLASGVRSSLIGRRSVRFLGVGCPSFGGQRSVGGGSAPPRAGLVTGSGPSLPAKRVGVSCSGSNSQTAGWSAPVGRRGHSERIRAVAGLSHFKVTALSRPGRKYSCRSGLTETANTKQPVRLRRASVTGVCVQSLARSSCSGRCAKVSPTPAPNHTVKGT
jgi:hypothetical protein